MPAGFKAEREYCKLARVGQVNSPRRPGVGRRRRGPNREDLVSAAGGARVVVEHMPDAVLLRHASGWRCVAAGFLATLPLPLLATIGTATILLATSDSPQPRRWAEWAVAIALFCGGSGGLAGLLARWGDRAGRWGEFTAGLVLWPASFPPSYAFVLTLDAASARKPEVLLANPVPPDWVVVAAEGLLLAACFATAWFGSWRWLFIRILGLWSRADERDIAADLLRQYYHRQWLSPEAASRHRARASVVASDRDTRVAQRQEPPKGA